MTKEGQVRIIRASAGSGKTYNLAKTYIKYLLGKKNGDKFELVKGRRNYHQHLLAITFTNAATDEMKKRIVKELDLLSKGKGFAGDFKTEFRNDINEVQDAAGAALTDILFSYSQFNVSTIDSFFQRILRAFAYELDRDAGYDLQLDEVVALQSSVHDFLMSLGRNASKDINQLVRSYVSEK
ncbi:MAG: UvrD-helicase domain-containing protein, partial [Muribaculaceae bacterium]|nr:UvrD-helicase domain-containing protein [Muribaculaceae bacterium]